MGMMSQFPILCYHHVGSPPAHALHPMLYVSAAQLDRQLWTLRRLGMRGVALDSALAEAGGNRRCVSLTFDDAYVDTVAAALPVLRAHGFTATCYVVSSRIGQRNTWDAEHDGAPLLNHAQLGEWLAAGMQIGSHSLTHPRLTTLDEALAFEEIAASRAALEREFALDVRHFAYPFGAHDARVREWVRRAGYAAAVTTEPGIADTHADRFRLPRLLVSGEQGWLRFLLRACAALGGYAALCARGII